MHFTFYIFGYIASFLTCVSYLPMFGSMILHGSGKNISYFWLSILLLDLFFYLTYGVGVYMDSGVGAYPIFVGGLIQVLLVLGLMTTKITLWLNKRETNVDSVNGSVNGLPT